MIEKSSIKRVRLLVLLKPGQGEEILKRACVSLTHGRMLTQGSELGCSIPCENNVVSFNEEETLTFYL